MAAHELHAMVKAIGLAIGVAIGLAPGVTVADTLRAPTDTAHAAAERALPPRGATMAQVEQRFGAPTRRYPPAGGDSPQHPPITRWDYPGFSVFFERKLVLDTVVPGHFPPIRHRDQLQPAG